MERFFVCSDDPSIKPTRWREWENAKLNVALYRVTFFWRRFWIVRVVATHEVFERAANANAAQQ